MAKHMLVVALMAVGSVVAAHAKAQNPVMIARALGTSSTLGCEPGQKYVVKGGVPGKIVDKYVFSTGKCLPVQPSQRPAPAASPGKK